MLSSGWAMGMVGLQFGRTTSTEAATGEIRLMDLRIKRKEESRESRERSKSEHANREVGRTRRAAGRVVACNINNGHPSIDETGTL